jgi:flagellar biogenesis protein FliO
MEAGRTIITMRRIPAAIAHLFATVRDVLSRVKVRRRTRSLRVCETLSLGERRFLMVVQFERRRFLIGATNQSISLVERLDDHGHASPEPEDSSWAHSSWKGPH